jgi:kynurenine formamidase
VDSGFATRDEILTYLRQHSNWGRWGPGDQRGAANLITPAKVARAGQAIQDGKTISLGRDFPSTASSANLNPAQHFVMDRVSRGSGGTVVDYIGIACHGISSTHLDALCHVWDADGMWGGRLPEDFVRSDGVLWAGVDQWRDGLVTRGVILDVPRHRGTAYVDIDEPVNASELDAIVSRQGLTIEAGDALVIYSGREAWSRERGEYGATRSPSVRGLTSTTEPRPGLHASCLKFIRESDCSIVAWDMMDAKPNAGGIAWAAHAALWAFGVALVDSALIEPLAHYCAERGRTDFMFVVSPLCIVGGTGSPVNPIAIV